MINTSSFKGEVLKATTKLNLSSEIDFSKAEIISFSETTLSSALWIPLNENNKTKSALYFIIYGNHVQLGYLMKWEFTTDGKITVSQYNMDDKLFVRYSAYKSEPVKIDLLETNNIISSDNLLSNSNARMMSCDFPTNFSNCAKNYLNQLSSNVIAGLGCLYFGAECATIIIGTCTVDAGVATSQNKCIQVVNPS